MGKVSNFCIHMITNNLVKLFLVILEKAYEVSLV